MYRSCAEKQVMPRKLKHNLLWNDLIRLERIMLACKSATSSTNAEGLATYSIVLGQFQHIHTESSLKYRNTVAVQYNCALQLKYLYSQISLRLVALQAVVENANARSILIFSSAAVLAKFAKFYNSALCLFST